MGEVRPGNGAIEEGGLPENARRAGGSPSLLEQVCAPVRNSMNAFPGCAFIDVETI